MRKRILIGLAVVVLVGVGGYVLSQPRNGSVDYHKAQYLAERNPTKFEGLMAAG